MNRIQIQTKKRSWAERHPIRSAVLYTGLTIGFIIFLATGGIAIVTQLASLIENSKPNSETVRRQTVLPVPNLETIPSITNNKNIIISGTSENGATVRIYLNGVPSDYVANSIGKFSANIVLNEGTNTIKAQTVDNSSSSLETDLHTVELDQTAPTIVINSPKDGEKFSGKKSQTITITGNVDSDSTISVNDHIIIVSTTGDFSYIYSLSEGENQLNFKANDKAGNETLLTVNVTFNP